MSIIINRFLISFIIFCSSHFVLSIEKGHYTIVAPGTIRPGSLFHVSLSLNDFNSPCWFNLSFKNFFNNKKLYEYESIQIEPKNTKLVELRAPSLDGALALANLEVVGYCGGLSNDTALIYFETEPFWTFIQTNKFKYQPGELVQFRVICIDQLTRPAKLSQNMTIQIYDDKHSLVMSFSDVKLVQGVFKSKFQLFNNSVLGLWKIRVVSKEIFEQKTFEVDRYEVQKFNVEIKTKKVISIDDNQIELGVTSSYFSGEPVKGNLSIYVSNTDLPWHKWFPTPPPILRETQINGKTRVLIDLRSDLQLENEETSEPLAPFSPPITPYIFHIEAYVIDSVSGEESWTTTEIQVHHQSYKIELQAPSEFDSDEKILKIKVKVNVKNFQDNEIQDIETPIEIILGCYEKIGKYIRSYADFDEVRIDYIKEIEKDYSIVNMKNNNYTECYIYAEYQGIKSSTERLYKKVKTFAMEVLTDIPEEGKELEIKITNPEPLDEFSYEIAARGDILQSGRIVVPKNQTCYILRLNVMFLMVPKITIYAHHIKDIYFSGQMKDVIIKRALQNSITIETVKETKPGASPVGIKVTTDKGSYVGVMALDQRGLENIDETYIFNEQNVNMKLRTVNSVRSYGIPFYGRTEDLITFSNVFPPGQENGSSGELPSTFFKNRISKLYPESWLFSDFERTSEEDFITFENVPDTITTWAITGFSLHPETGLAFTKNSTNLKVFQNMSISMNLPNSLKEDITMEKWKASSVLLTQHNVTVTAISSLGSHDRTEDLPYAMLETNLDHLPEENIQKNEIRIGDSENEVFGSKKMDSLEFGN